MTYLCCQFHKYLEQCLHQVSQGVNAHQESHTQVTWLLLSLISTTYWLQMVWLLEYLFLCTHTHTHRVYKISPTKTLQNVVLWGYILCGVITKSRSDTVLSLQRIRLKDKASDGEESFHCSQVQPSWTRKPNRKAELVFLFFIILLKDLISINSSSLPWRTRGVGGGPTVVSNKKETIEMMSTLWL